MGLGEQAQPEVLRDVGVLIFVHQNVAEARLELAKNVGMIAEEADTLQKKVAEVESQIMERESKGLVRDPMLDTAYQDLENLRSQLQQAQEKLFDVGLYITIYASTIEELDKVIRAHLSAL